MSESLEDVQDRVLDALHAGEAPDREALLAAHPEHAEALGRFLDLLAEIEQAPRAGDRPPARLGEFRIVREIGRGGMGVVYEAEQPSLRRRVALKVLPPALAHDPRVLARFRREAEAAGRLRHPNIVPVFSVGESGGTPFFAMELVAGRSLAEVIRERAAGGGAPMTPDAWRRWAVDVVARVADALHAAHAERILHRDVKPANVILEPSGTPRLTDFGLAADLAAPGLTMSGETFGTPLYMSPEQALRREAPLDPRTDVYSLGVTLYELLTLRSPYDATTTPEILSALQKGLLVAPRTLDAAFPELLERVVLRAMRRSPEDRYVSAAAFAVDLRNWLADRPVEPPAGGPSRFAPQRAGASKPPAPVAAARRARPRLALASAAVALALFVLWWMNPREPREGLVLGGGPITAAELRALVAGTDPQGAAKLKAWIRPRPRLRSLLARSHPGDYRIELVPGFTDPAPMTGVDALVLARFEVRYGEGDAVSAGMGYTGLLASGVATSRDVTVPFRDRVTALRADPSLRVRHHARIRLVQFPAALQRMSGLDDAALEAAWRVPGGTECEWGDDRTVFIHADVPDDVPALTSDAGIDDAMMRALTPSEFWFGRLTDSASGTSGAPARTLLLMFRGVPVPGPVPAAFDVELLEPSSGRTVGTTTLTVDERSGNGDPSERVGLGLAFDLAATRDPADSKLIVDIAEGRAETVTLRLRPSRGVALASTDFERIWGRELCLVVPSIAARRGGRSTQARSSAFTPPRVIRLRDLAAGTLPDGADILGRLVKPDVRLRRLVSRKSPGPYPVSMAIDLGGMPGDSDVVLLSLWESCAGSGPWLPVQYAVNFLGSGGVGGVTGSGDLARCLGEAMSRASVDVKHRLTVKAARRPARCESGFWGVESHAVPQPEWAQTAGSVWTWTSDPVTVLVYDDFPDDYPEAVDADEFAVAMRASVSAMSGGVCTIGPGRLLDVPFNFPPSGPIPVACEVDLVADDGGVVGTATYTRPAADASTMSLGLKFALAEPAAAAEQVLLLELAKGGSIHVKLRFRPSRDVARRLTAFDRYWGRPVTVPVSIGGM